MKLIPETEIAFKNKQTALEVAAALVDEEYVVMLSKEEQLYIINYLWSSTSDRNDVIFADRGEYEDDLCDNAQEQK